MGEQKQQSGFTIIYKGLLDFTKETLPDLAETTIDMFSDDGFLKDFPIVGTFIRGIKSIIGIRDVFLTKHFLVFTQRLNSNSLPQEKIKRHYEELEKNPKKKLRELEAVLQSISKHKKYIQDKILANFYAAYCDPDVIDFNWPQFELMSQITEGLFPYDLIELKKVYDAGKVEKGNFDASAILRLSILGLLAYSSGELRWDSTISNGNIENIENASINKIGKIFWLYGMQSIEDELDKPHNDGAIL